MAVSGVHWSAMRRADEGLWNAWGGPFDFGATTSEALHRIKKGSVPNRRPVPGVDLSFIFLLSRAVNQ